MTLAQICFLAIGFAKSPMEYLPDCDEFGDAKSEMIIVSSEASRFTFLIL